MRRSADQHTGYQQLTCGLNNPTNTPTECMSYTGLCSCWIDIVTSLRSQHEAKAPLCKFFLLLLAVARLAVIRLLLQLFTAHTHQVQAGVATAACHVLSAVSTCTKPLSHNPCLAPAADQCHPSRQVYIHHFCGHYIFLPLFFSGALFRWIMPHRWRLPAKQMEQLSINIRVIARLLWIVHLEYSQEVREVCPYSVSVLARGSGARPEACSRHHT